LASILFEGKGQILDEEISGSEFFINLNLQSNSTLPVKYLYEKFSGDTLSINKAT
jgi:hypothetical protein